MRIGLHDTAILHKGNAEQCADRRLPHDLPENARKPGCRSSLTPRPGNGRFLLEAERRLPVSIVATETPHDEGSTIEICITALKEVWFQYSQTFDTGFAHDECQFLMPGFWYRQNLRSPKEAPSFHTSDSWTVREDRLSTRLTGIFDPASGKYHTVLRVCGAGLRCSDDPQKRRGDALGQYVDRIHGLREHRRPGCAPLRIPLSGDPLLLY